MSYHIHCDQCREYMFQTTPGTEVCFPQSVPRYNGLVFCGEKCLKEYLLITVWNAPGGQVLTMATSK